MWRRGAVVVFGAGGMIAACGGLTGEVDETTPLVDAGAQGTDGGLVHDAEGGAKDADADARDALSEFVDPGCPDASPPIQHYDCDPIKSTGCGPGMACEPFVEYPTSPCGSETYGAICQKAGSGGQGDPCTAGCKAHHVCVVSGQGTQCVELCDLSQFSSCKTNGLVCEPLDVPGIGGCL